MPDQESSEERFARAHAEAQAYRGRGAAETLEQFLSAHTDLRDLLEPMLSEDDESVPRTEPLTIAVVTLGA